MRITEERHAFEYMFLHKNDPLCMAYHPYHFVGEVLLHPLYIYKNIFIKITCDCVHARIIILFLNAVLVFNVFL